jgi:hypothetical protein
MTASVAFRLAFTAQPPTIICAGCGETECQAGIAVEPDAIRRTGETSVVDTSAAKPLCEACVKLLMVGQ